MENFVWYLLGLFTIPTALVIAAITQFLKQDNYAKSNEAESGELAQDD